MNRTSGGDFNHLRFPVFNGGALFIKQPKVSKVRKVSNFFPVTSIGISTKQVEPSISYMQVTSNLLHIDGAITMLSPANNCTLHS